MMKIRVGFKYGTLLTFSGPGLCCVMRRVPESLDRNRIFVVYWKRRKSFLGFELEPNK